MLKRNFTYSPGSSATDLVRMSMCNNSGEMVGMFYAWSNTAFVNIPNSARFVISVANANATDATIPTEDFIFFHDGNFTITGPTAVKSSGTSWTNPSDRRIKKNI
jgi:hypothetical protein